MLCLFTSVFFAMENEQSKRIKREEWFDSTRNQDGNKWKTISPYETPEDHISVICNILNLYSLIDLCSSVAVVLRILSIPQLEYPDREFTTTFFDNLCAQNNIFLKARDIVVGENEKYIKSNVKGSTIDNCKTIIWPGALCLSASLQRYLHKKTMEKCKEERSVVFQAHAEEITGISMNAKEVVSGSKDKTVKVWSARTGELLESMQYDQSVACVALHPYKPIVATVTQDALYLCDTETGSSLKMFKHKECHFDRAYFDLTGRYITAYNTQENKQWMMIVDDNNELTELCVTCVPVSNNSVKRCSFATHEVVVADNNCLLFKVKTYASALCESAYNNSKNDIRELGTLKRSQLLQNKLFVNDRDLLAKRIQNDLFMLLTHQK